MWTDGRKYIGEWKDDEKDGEGQYINEEGEEVKQKWMVGKLIKEVEEIVAEEKEEEKKEEE